MTGNERAARKIECWKARRGCISLFEEQSAAAASVVFKTGEDKKEQWQSGRGKEDAVLGKK